MNYRSPCTMTTGASALFQQQIVASLGPRHGRLRFLFALCLTALITISVVKITSRHAFKSAGENAFHSLIIVDLIILFSLTLSSFCNVIAAEKDAGTLANLRIVALSPAALLFAKSTSLYARTILFFFAQLPFASFCVTAGGVGYGKIAANFAMLATLAWLGCNMGLFFSVIGKTARHAGQMMFFAGAAVWFGPDILIWLLGLSRANMFPISETLARISPQACIQHTLTMGDFPWLSFFLYGTAGLVFFATSAALFDRMCERDTEKPASLGVARKKQIRHARVTTRPGRRPIAWREFHFAAGGRKGICLRCICYFFIPIAAGGVAFVFGGRNYVIEVIGAAFLYLGAFGLLCEIPYTAARIFGLEVSEKTIDSLVALPISAHRILREKIFGVLPTFIPSLAAFTVGAILLHAQVAEAVVTTMSEPFAWVILVFVTALGTLVLMLTMYFSIANPRSGFLPAVLSTGFSCGIIFVIAEKTGLPVPAALFMIMLLALLALKYLIGNFPAMLQRAGGK